MFQKVRYSFHKMFQKVRYGRRIQNRLVIRCSALLLNIGRRKVFVPLFIKIINFPYKVTINILNCGDFVRKIIIAIVFLKDITNYLFRPSIHLFDWVDTKCSSSTFLAELAHPDVVKLLDGCFHHLWIIG